MQQSWDDKSDSARVEYLKDMLKIVFGLFSDHTKRLSKLEEAVARIGLLEHEIERVGAERRRPDSRPRDRHQEHCATSTRR